MGKVMYPVLYTGDDEVILPWRWEICPACDGHETDRGASVECDGGGFTASEWADQDEDFREDYLAGRYDRPCEECGGTGKVRVINEDKCAPGDAMAYRQQQEDFAEMNAIQEMERRMGA